MKIVRVRFREAILAFDDRLMPVKYHFTDSELGLTIEVRMRERLVFIYAALDCSGRPKYVGNPTGHWAHNDSELTAHIAAEMFKLADELEIPAHHIWPFVEQLPLYTENGVSVDEAMALAEPIKDLLARGASPIEVMSSLQVSKELLELVLGTRLPERRQLNEPYEPDYTNY